jgi:pimeloyl-ACP methyl ester carboxylesterase
MHQDIRFCKAQDGVRLAYAVSGDGPPLVMSATFLTHLEHQWRSLAWRPWLDAFMHDYKLLRYDVRGCGLSDRDPPDLSFENWVRDFARVIDAAAFDRFAILATCGAGRSRSNMQRVIRSASATSFSMELMPAGAFGGRTGRTSASAPARYSK